MTSRSRARCGFPGCTCRDGCQLLTADSETEAGSIRRERWIVELKKHLPDREFKAVRIRLCVCHFRPEDMSVDPDKGTLRLNPGALPDVAMSAMKLRIRVVEEERDALRAEVNTLKNILTAEQFEEYTNIPILMMKKLKKDNKRKRLNDDSRDEEADTDVRASTHTPPQNVPDFVSQSSSSS